MVAVTVENRHSYSVTGTAEWLQSQSHMSCKVDKVTVSQGWENRQSQAHSVTGLARQTQLLP